jgi:hypothetical protein
MRKEIGGKEVNLMAEAAGSSEMLVPIIYISCDVRSWTTITLIFTIVRTSNLV